MATSLPVHPSSSGSSKSVLSDSVSGDQPENSTVKRHAKACFECQRRKQKCTRIYPCNHCSHRRLIHLCRFPGEKGEVTEEAAFAKNPKKRKDESSETEAESGQSGEAAGVETGDVLKVLGYMPDHQHFGLGTTPEADSPDDLPECQTEQAKAVRTALEDLRSLLDKRGPIDKLVVNFFQASNYHYYMVYPPLFTEEYHKWWTLKDSGDVKGLNPAFTSLLLRALACSLQFLGENVRPRIERDLGDPQTLTERFHLAARQVNDSMSPGDGGLFQVQQLLMTSWWFKSETRFVESWHALAAAIYAAQEFGMDADPKSQNLSEFDAEIRGRVWCLLYLWDWQMSALLGRPIILNHAQCYVCIPQIHLEKPPGAGDDLPSPYEHIALSADLVKTVSSKVGAINKESDIKLASKFEQVIRDWMKSNLTGVYGVVDPDIKYDNTYRYIVWQRQQLHLVAYLTGVIPLKAYFIRPPEMSKEQEESARLRAVAVDWCLSLMDCSRGLFELIYPAYAKYHFGLFCVFDCAASLCSALTHDDKRDLPQRERVIDAVVAGLDMMRHLRTVTRIGEMSYQILVKLVAGLPLTQQEKSARNMGPPKRVKKDSSSETTGSGSSGSGLASASNTLPQTEATLPTDVPAMPVPSIIEPFSFTLPELASAGPLTYNDVSETTMGDFHLIFDYEGLALDFSTPALQPVILPPLPNFEGELLDPQSPTLLEAEGESLDSKAHPLPQLEGECLDPKVLADPAPQLN